MGISAISSASGNSYVPANGSREDSVKIKSQIEALEQKIKNVENSFNSPKSKEAQKQQLEAQISQKEAALKQAQQSNSSSKDSNTDNCGKANNVQSASSEPKPSNSIIDVKV